MDDQAFGNTVSRMIRDGVRSEFMEMLTEQRRSGGILNPVNQL